MICSFFHQVGLIIYPAFPGYLASNINCVIPVIPMDFWIVFYGGKFLVAGGILVSSESCKMSTFFFPCSEDISSYQAVLLLK